MFRKLKIGRKSEEDNSPIDLSRQCDSVETRKTTSPCGSSTSHSSSAYMHKQRTPSPVDRESSQDHQYIQYNMDTESNGYTFNPTTLQALQDKLESQIDSDNNSYSSILTTRDRKATGSFSVLASSDRYSLLRKQLLDQIYAPSSGISTITNPRMRRKTSSTASSANFECKQQSAQMQEQQQQQAVSIAEQNQPHLPPTHARAADVAPGPIKDAAYFERRKKNNEAAKKSRDRRRIKEDENFIRAAILEHENLALKVELEATKRQLAQYMLA